MGRLGGAYVTTHSNRIFIFSSRTYYVKYDFTRSFLFKFDSERAI